MKTGDRVLVSDGHGWTIAVYLFTNKYDRHICQRPYDWEHGHISLEIWDEVKPAPRTETRVKKASEIMKWLEENGAEIDEDGDWIGNGYCISRYMWEFCGKQKPGEYVWHRAWLEEVEA